MILFMHRYIIVVVMACWIGASFSCTGVSAQEPDRILVLQDENYFLRQENQKLKAELARKDEAVARASLEKESARADLKRAVREKAAVELKVSGLEKSFLSCDEQLPRKAEEAAASYRASALALARDNRILQLTLEEKNSRFAQAGKEKDALRARIEALSGEKIVLRDSLKKVAAQLDAARADGAARVAKERFSNVSRLSDLKTRLSAEQILVDEKMAQVKKPLEEKIVALEAALKERVAPDENVRKLEAQIVSLRENSGLEVKRVQDASRDAMKKIQDQLDACRSRRPGK